MDKQFHLTLYQACNDLSMLGLKLNHVSKGVYWGPYSAYLHWLTLIPNGAPVDEFLSIYTGSIYSIVKACGKHDFEILESTIYALK